MTSFDLVEIVNIYRYGTNDFLIKHFFARINKAGDLRMAMSSTALWRLEEYQENRVTSILTRSLGIDEKEKSRHSLSGCPALVKGSLSSLGRTITLLFAAMAMD